MHEVVMRVEIQKRKKSTYTVLRTSLTFIYMIGKEICVTSSHPNFVLAKDEETTILPTQENIIIHVELTDEQYT